MDERITGILIPKSFFSREALLAVWCEAVG